MRFLLISTRYYRLSKPIIVRNVDGTFESKRVKFETLVNPKTRKTAGKKKSAEFLTSDPQIIEGLYADKGYGKSFYEEGDVDGKRKITAFDIGDEAKKKAAIRSLYEQAGMQYDPNLPYDVLKLGLEMAMGGAKSAPTPMSEQKINPEAEIADAKAKQRELYFELYGEDVPDSVRDDSGFLSALSDPEFDAATYIEKAEAKLNDEFEKAQKQGAQAETKETLHAAYFKKFSKKVAPAKSNDLAWIKGKLAE